MWRPFTGSLPHTPTRSTPPTETGGAEEVGNTGTGVNKRLKACLSAQPGQVTSLSEKSWFQRMQHPPGLQGRREEKWHLGEPETTPLDSLLPLEDGVWPGSGRTGGIPGGTSSKKKKKPTCQCRRHKSHWFDPQVGKIPWAWQSTPVFLPGDAHGQRSLAGYSLWGHKESDTTEVN